MPTTAPHYLLLTETDDRSADNHGGRWRFVLESMTSDDDRIEVSERESDIKGERLQLLAVVRGVEALEQPSRLTLITSSAYVGKRIRKGFDRWIENEWRWERFGALKPIKDADLWKRIHAATLIHKIECRLWQFGTQRRTVEPQNAEMNSWTRIDDNHSTPRRPFGPVEFENNRNTVRQPELATASHGTYHEPRFVATKTGWTRVTEIDPDTNQPLQFPQAFGETAH
ncbi:RNase H family protein [Mariniblastus fucicola]|nr:RNase H family protein [Mariniblastus fucicola]